MENIFYFAQIFGALSGICIVLFVIASIALTSSIILYHCSANYKVKYSDYDKEDHISSGKTIKWLIPLTIFFALCLVFIPSKKTYLFMVGGRTIDNIVEKNPDIEELPANTLNLLNEYIKEKTEELNK